MTLQEMTEIFGYMMLNGNWENAKMFNVPIERLDITTRFWADCLEDIDYWIAQHALKRLCKNQKFCPTIADFREQAQKVQKDFDSEISMAFQRIRWSSMTDGIEKLYYQLDTRNISDRRIKRVIDTMGGYQNLTKNTPDGESIWCIDEFTETYWKLLRSNPVLKLTAGKRQVTQLVEGRSNESLSD